MEAKILLLSALRTMTVSHNILFIANNIFDVVLFFIYSGIIIMMYNSVQLSLYHFV